MSRRNSSARRGVLAVLASAALAGCQTMQGAASPSSSTMDSANLLLRSQLAVVPQPIPRLPLYASVARCIYHQVSTRATAVPSDTRFELSIRPIRDRLLITLREGARASTALIGPDGTLHDFNLIDVEGRRWTMEGYGPGVGNGKLINQFMVAFPRYQQSLWNVGDSVAEVLSQDGTGWGHYVYRGLTTYGGSEAAVLDLVVPVEGRLVQVAFNVVDIRTMTPVLNIFDAGSSTRLERERCG